jgi:hypothetical protein
VRENFGLLGLLVLMRDVIQLCVRNQRLKEEFVVSIASRVRSSPSDQRWPQTSSVITADVWFRRSCTGIKGRSVL